jgi:anti-sigma B factor antagonist
MSLSIDSHRAGEITVLTCSGRIVEGAESATLQKHVDALIAEGPYIILNLGGIEFIDSSGLGLLVRCLIRLESLHGLIRVCAASSRIAEAFRVTGLNTLFKVFDSEADAVAGFYDLPAASAWLERGTTSSAWSSPPTSWPTSARCSGRPASSSSPPRICPTR